MLFYPPTQPYHPTNPHIDPAFHTHSDSFANGEGKAFTVRCDTEEELIVALEKAKAHDGLAFIELTIDKDDCSKQLLEWGARVSAANGRAFVEL